MSNFLTELFFLFQRLDWISLVDILLVAAVVFAVLSAVRGTQAVVLLRGVIILIVLVASLSTFLRLPAFTWLLRSTVPALLLAVPVIFQPELRRALERLGRAGVWFSFGAREPEVQPVIQTIAAAAEKMAERRHGGLLVIEREVGLQEYLDTGVALDAVITVELITQVFYPNSPLHDGAVILRGDRLAAAACVLPLSTGVTSADRLLGLRHRAALGVSESTDAVAIVVSEETGIISVAHNGRLIRRLDEARLHNILGAFYRPRSSGWPLWVSRAFARPAPAVRKSGSAAAPNPVSGLPDGPSGEAEIPR